MITVVGSLNLDLFVDTHRLPAPGETVLGHGFRREPGGKGANQACAAARMDQPVTFIGAVGRDPFGQQLMQNLQDNHIDITHVARREDVPTGTAFIVVDVHGQNQIVVNSGANATLTAADVDMAAPQLRRSQAVLTQLESPPDAVEAALRAARAAGALAVLNPAPFRSIPAETLRLCDWIIPNALEAGMLAQLTVQDPADAAEAARVLREQTKGVNVAITLGAAGVWIESKAFRGHVPGFTVKAIDTVAAGDAFIGAFICRLIEGAGPEEAARFGCAAAALSVTRRGAQASLPRRTEVTAFLDEAQNVGAPVFKTAATKQ